jgi:NAD(P)-dependent dehydrogenase (short-subunit alcohol dehydrogenase family)
VREFGGKVAVVTGAASGIGRALAERCAREGMRVVLADVEPAALDRAAAELKANGAEVLAVATDVSKASDIEALAQQTLEVFGAVHLLCNNAGVGAGSTVWESTLADWEWVLGVNLWGVIHGVRTFVPIMLAQGDECHVVNTASIAGLIAGPGLGVYKVTKHAVVTLSETLHYDLAMRGANIGVSVLCPEWVNTRIMESERNRPESLQNNSVAAQITPEMLAVWQYMSDAVRSGMSPAEVADQVFSAIRAQQLYILTHPATKALVRERMDDILGS